MDHPLTAVRHAHLTPNVLRHLAQTGIQTVADLFRCDPKELQRAFDLPADQVRQLKDDLVGRFGPTMCDGRTAKNRRLPGTFVLRTGQPSLDALMGGGLSTGSVVELCGPAASGKTLLADSIALHFVRTHRVPVYYVSTKNACSSRRWFRLLKSDAANVDHHQADAEGQRRQQQHDIGAALARLRCETVQTLSDLLRMLRVLLAEPAAHSDYQMLFIDSLTALMLPFSGAMHKRGLSLMAEALGLLRQLAAEQQKIVMFETLVLNVRHHADKMQQVLENTAEPFVSTISRYWPTIPTIRLFVYRHRRMDQTALSTSERPQFKAVLLKSHQHRSGRDVSCDLILGE